MPIKKLPVPTKPTEAQVQPWPENHRFWQYKGKPVYLIGGTKEDNLFQISGLEGHLDELVECGGNYARSTLSCRDKGDVWPFKRDPVTQLYDLETPEGPFWERFETFLRETRKRDIIIQIEVFDRFDCAQGPWLDNPFNPKNNVNYSAEESDLALNYEKHASTNETPFFRSVPDLEDNPLLLRYQQKFVDRLLQVTLDQPHVLYCISNETSESPNWSNYWAKYILKKATDKGVCVFQTEMWDARKLDSQQHANTYANTDLYSFVDISQVNHQVGEEHWENLMRYRDLIEATGLPRPRNSVKIYGANTGYFGTTCEAQDRFWRNIFAGLASVRFHRPPLGLGLSAIARNNIQAARMLLDRIEIFDCLPNAARMLNRSTNESFCMGIPGQAYAVYFPRGGNVHLQPDGSTNTACLSWLDIRELTWSPQQSIKGNVENCYDLATPSDDSPWIALLEMESD